VSTNYKLTVLGDGGCGKTAITIQFCSNHFVEQYDPTIESSYRRQIVVDDEACVLDILDTAGQEEYTAMRSQWIRQGDAFLIVYDLTKLSSFQHVAQFRDQVIREKEAEASNSDPPLVICGNKLDLEHQREVSAFAGQELAKSFNAGFFEVSAKTRANIDDAFADIVRRIRGFPKPTTATTQTQKNSSKSSLKSSLRGCQLL